MLRQIALFVTVIDVIRDMGVETEKGLDWAVGAAMARWWKKHTSCDPPKDNRKKTNGGGSHCFAHYHESYREKIESFVRAYQLEAARQPDLFAREVAAARAGVEVDLRFDGNGNGAGVEVELDTGPTITLLNPCGPPPEIQDLGPTA